MRIAPKSGDLRIALTCRSLLTSWSSPVESDDFGRKEGHVPDLHVLAPQAHDSVFAPSLFYRLFMRCSAAKTPQTPTLVLYLTYFRSPFMLHKGRATRRVWWYGWP